MTKKDKFHLIKWITLCALAFLLCAYGFILQLNGYGKTGKIRQDLTKIVKRSSKILNVKIEEEAAVEIARRSRGTPRIANRLLKRVRDYALVLSDGNIDLKVTKHALNQLEINELGLDETDRKLLEIMITQYRGRPVGIDALASSLGEEVDTIEDVYEPYLLQIGFIARTPRGRMPMPGAYEHLGFEFLG